MELTQLVACSIKEYIGTLQKSKAFYCKFFYFSSLTNHNDSEMVLEIRKSLVSLIRMFMLEAGRPCSDGIKKIWIYTVLITSITENQNSGTVQILETMKNLKTLCTKPFQRVIRNVMNLLDTKQLWYSPKYSWNRGYVQSKTSTTKTNLLFRGHQPITQDLTLVLIQLKLSTLPYLTGFKLAQKLIIANVLISVFQLI